MHKAIFFLFIIGVAPLALSTPGPSPVEIICTTTLSDKLLTAVDNAIKMVRERIRECRQTTPTTPPNESECTVLVESNGIGILICGPTGVRRVCSVIADALEKVTQKCPKTEPKRPNKAGNRGGEYIIHMDGGNVNFKLTW